MSNYYLTAAVRETEWKKECVPCLCRLRFYWCDNEHIIPHIVLTVVHLQEEKQKYYANIKQLTASGQTRKIIKKQIHNYFHSYYTIIHNFLNK